MLIKLSSGIGAMIQADAYELVKAGILNTDVLASQNNGKKYRWGYYYPAIYYLAHMCDGIPLTGLSLACIVYQFPLSACIY